MRELIAHRWPWLFVVIGLTALVLLPVSACRTGRAEPEAEAPAPAAAADTGPCTSNGVALDLDCPALPDTTAIGQWVSQQGTPLNPQPASGQSDSSAYLDYDLWAWNSFIALNWPALDPSGGANPRGFPDLGKTFAAAANDDPTVWETYKEKREVFLYDYVDNEPSTETPLGWNSPPQYGPSDAQVPCCPGQDCDNGGMERHLANSSKLFLDTLDETAEVASEALETREVLCAGWVDPATQCDTIGANTCCTLNSQPVGPRVWLGDPHTDSDASPVLYEVKVNYDFFEYVTDSSNQYYLVSKVRPAAAQGEVTLPARTTFSAMPLQPGQGEVTPPPPRQAGFNPGPTSYSAGTCYQGFVDPAPSATPCLAGSVHLKAAWLNLEGASADELAKYHVADVLHYVSNDSVPGGICKEPATYGLIGLHIIQRVHQDVQLTQGAGGGAGQARGGTFVFATWEHVDNDQAGFTYANYSSAPPTGQPGRPAPFPNIANASALQLDRVYPPLASTERATALVHGQLGCDGDGGGPVWCNYELVGVQYAAAQLPSPEPTQLTSLQPQPMNIEVPPNSGQPYYLANLVVESNVGLQQFQGLPPSSGDAAAVIQVIPHYQPAPAGVGNVTSQFSAEYQRSAANLAYRSRSGGENPGPRQFTMGGCMGCHGVAQLSGYAFSFVLLDNQYGAAPDTLEDFEIPPTPVQPTPPPPPPP